MTILASNAKDKIVYNDRDNIVPKDTLKEMKKVLSNGKTITYKNYATLIA